MAWSWPGAESPAWDPRDQAGVLAELEDELPALLAAELRLQGWFEVPWTEGGVLLRVRADRFPSVDAHETRLADGRPVAGALIESWHLPGERNGYPPAGLARWTWQIWLLGGIESLRAASQIVTLEARLDAAA